MAGTSARLRPAYPGIGFSPDGGAALGRIKRLVHDGASADFAARLDAEAEQIAASATGEDGREGVRAFLERRPPRFHGEPAVPVTTD